jgi:hypothetical protein
MRMSGGRGMVTVMMTSLLKIRAGGDVGFAYRKSPAGRRAISFYRFSAKTF